MKKNKIDIALERYENYIEKANKIKEDYAELSKNYHLLFKDKNKEKEYYDLSEKAEDEIDFLGIHTHDVLTIRKIVTLIRNIIKNDK